MLFIPLVFASLASSATLTRHGSTGRLTVRDPLPASYRIEPMKWTGPLVPGHENVTLEGTIQEVAAQLEQARKSAGIALNETVGRTEAYDNVSNEELLAARQYEGTICYAGLKGPAGPWAIDEGIAYLKRVDGNCGLGPGPGTCGRVSCSYNSAIYWCNDKPVHRSWPCADFAIFAQAARDECTYRDTGMHRHVWGQVFDEQKLNVMVGGDSC